jgi:hypothetical protein
MLQFSDSIYGLDVHRILGRPPAEAIDVSLQTAPAPGATQPLPHSMDPGSSFPRVRRLGHEADHLRPSSAEVKIEWSYTSPPPICLHELNRDYFDPVGRSV